MTDPICPKCKHKDIAMRWHNWMSYEPSFYGFGGADHMHYYCQTCKYQWVVDDEE